MSISRFNDIITHHSSTEGRKRLAVIWPADDATREAVAEAIKYGAVEAIAVGCRDEVEADETLKACAPHVSVVDAADPDDAAAKAVALARNGEADIIMKGMINTDNMLRAVLDKQCGILRQGNVLTHITIAEIPDYPRLLLFTDVAVIPYPTAKQREAQLRYLLTLAGKLHIAEPKVVMVHCSEKADTRHFPFMENYIELKQRAAEGEFGACVLDGPLDVKTALSPAALAKKGLTSPVGGEADALIFPDIVSGNTFYKTLTLFGGAKVAGLVYGAMVPIVLCSRGDSKQSKTLSILTAAM